MDVIARQTSGPLLSLVDLIYLAPWVVGSVLQHDMPNLATVVVAPILIASWWQDWKSARAADSYFVGGLVGYDVLTAANYVGLVDGWRRPVSEGQLLSKESLLHWTLVFVIYIVWNLALIRRSDRKTHTMFTRFTLAELPLVAVGGALTLAAFQQWHLVAWVGLAGVALLAAGHIALLVGWRLMSRGGES